MGILAIFETIKANSSNLIPILTKFKKDKKQK